MGNCCGNGHQNQPQLPDREQENLILDIEQQLLLKEKQVKEYDKKYIEIQNEYQQLLQTYPKSVQQQLNEQQTLEQTRSYLIDLTNSLQIDHKKIIEGAKNLQTIENNFKALQKPEQIRELKNFNNLKYEQKKNQFRQERTQQNDTIRQLNDRHTKFLKVISDRMKIDQQNKNTIEAFQKQVQKKLDEGSKTLDEKDKKYNECLEKLNQVRQKVELQIQIIENYESVIQPQQLDLQEWAQQKQNRIQQSKQHIAEQKRIHKEYQNEFDNLKKQFKDNQLDSPQEIEDLDQKLKHIEVTLQQKEIDLKNAEQLPVVVLNDPIQQELLYLLNFGQEFQDIENAFIQIQKDIFIKLEDDILEITKIAKQSLKA